MKILKLILLPLLCCIQADAQITCDASLSKPLCPGTTASCTCVVSGTGSFTKWSFTAPNNAMYCPSNNFVLVQIGGSSCGTSSGSCGPSFQAANQPPAISGGPCATSTLTITASSNISGLVASCADVGSSSVMIGNVTITIAAPPGPPNVMAQTIGPDMVQVVVSPSPNGDLPTSYNVTISNSSYTMSSPVVMANGSAMVNFTGLRNDSTYNISVVAINCAGNNSTQSYISWPASSPSPQTTSSVPLTSSTSTLPPPAPNTAASAIGPIVGGVVGGVIFIIIVIIIIVLIVFIVLKKPKSEAHDGVPLKTTNSPTPATPTSVGRDTPPPRPSRDTPSPPPGPNTEAEYSTVDASKKPQNQGMVYAEVGIRPPASSQQRKPAPNPSSQQVYYGEVRAQ